MDSILDQFHKNSGRLSNAVVILLIIYMSWSLAAAILFFAENTGDTISAQTDVFQGPHPASSLSSVDLSALNLFGSSDDKTEIVQTLDAPETRLNLQLQGVFKADVKDRSTAIIAERNKEGILYRIGDSLPGNAILFEVFDDHVLIKRGTAVEKLMFDDIAIRIKSEPSRTAENNPSQNKLPAPLQTQQRLNSGRRNLVGMNYPEDIRSKIDEYKARFDADPNSVLTEFGLSPMEDGSASGYQLDSGPASAALKKSGLQDGDIILSVNGKPVGNTANDSSLIDSSINTKRLRVEVKRGSRRFFITVPVP